MRLSDAIALGRTMITATPGRVFGFGSDSGCALGMGLRATGHVADVSDIEWPWILAEREKPLPCGCAISDYHSGAGGTIAHLFDFHVFNKRDWTLDQLIDWVRANEPVEARAEEETIAESAPSLVAQG